MPVVVPKKNKSEKTLAIEGFVDYFQIKERKDG